MKKKSLLLLILALSLVLSGCSLVVKDPVVDLKQTILDINGQAVDKQSFLGDYNAQLNQEYQMQQMYQMYGMQAPAIDYAAVESRARDAAVRRVIIDQQAAQLKLGELTDEEKAQVAADTDTEYKDTLEQIKSYYFADTKLEGEALDVEIGHMAEDLGVSREVVEQGVIQRLVSQKLEDETTKDVAVTEDEVKADYDAKVEQNKTAYTENPDAYGSAVNGGSTAYWVPEGYRYVKQVLVKFLPEDQQEIDRLQGEKTTADGELQAAEAAKQANVDALAAEGITEDDKKSREEQAPALQSAVDEAQQKVDQLAQELLAARNKGYEAILPKAQDVYNKAKTESFDDLVKEFNEDTGMPATGYAVREGFASFDEAFVKPAMALQNVGDVAEPSQGMYGYYIVQYAAPITAGPVDFAGVQQSLHDALLTQKKTTTWEDAITKWTEAADIKEYLERARD